MAFFDWLNFEEEALIQQEHFNLLMEMMDMPSFSFNNSDPEEAKELQLDQFQQIELCIKAILKSNQIKHCNKPSVIMENARQTLAHTFASIAEQNSPLPESSARMKLARLVIGIAKCTRVQSFLTANVFLKGPKNHDIVLKKSKIAMLWTHMAWIVGQP